MLGTRWFEVHARLFGWMASRHDVDWGRASGPAGAVAVRHAVTTCLGCSRSQDCETAFRSAPKPVEELTFCPNQPLFASWSRQGEQA